ncbi:MAG: hypothetical protein HYV13_02220 [Candidatus Doudnabacteria bacterium]|nr:hypothetical protein [Candidatus Doudnabacteria bacterium]
MNPSIGRFTAALQRRKVPEEVIAEFVKGSRGKDGGLTLRGMRFMLNERDDARQIIDEACGAEAAPPAAGSLGKSEEGI